MASSTLKRWLRPEVYPLFAAVGVAVGICGMQLIRNISTNPEVSSLYMLAHSTPLDGETGEKIGTMRFRARIILRVNKENRSAGILENFAEGEKYSQHALRKYVRGKSPEIMPGVNGFFTDPQK